jgi:hypothetical protein
MRRLLLSLTAPGRCRPRDRRVRRLGRWLRRGRAAGREDLGVDLPVRARHDPRRRQGPHAVPLREGQGRPEPMLGRVREHLAPGAGGRRGPRRRGDQRGAPPLDPSRRRTQGGVVRRPPALLLISALLVFESAAMRDAHAAWAPKHLLTPPAGLRPVTSASIHTRPRTFSSESSFPGSSRRVRARPA